MTGNEYELISVQDLAKRLNVTKQTIYNQIHCGMWDTHEYQRGKYKGFLIKYPKNDESDND